MISIFICYVWFWKCALCFDFAEGELIELGLVEDHQPIKRHHRFATMYWTQSTETKDMRSSVKYLSSIYQYASRVIWKILKGGADLKP
jgi:hypothetical protein